MSIEYIHSTEIDDPAFWVWMKEVDAHKFFAVRKAYRYHIISYDGRWGYCAVQYEPEELFNDGKVWSPLVMVSDFRRTGRHILKKWDRDQIQKTKIIMAYKIATYVFEVDKLEGGYTRTPGNLGFSFNNQKRWLDPHGNAYQTDAIDNDGNKYVDWKFDRKDWASGTYQQMYKDAIENF